MSRAGWWFIALLVLVGVCTFALLSGVVRTNESAVARDFLRAIARQDVDALFTQFHPALSATVDRRSVDQWLAGVHQQMGAPSEVETFSAPATWRIVCPDGCRAGSRRFDWQVDSAADVDFERGTARISLRKVDGLITEFTWATESMDWRWQPRPDDLMSARERAREYLRLLAVSDPWEIAAAGPVNFIATGYSRISYEKSYLQSFHGDSSIWLDAGHERFRLASGQWAVRFRFTNAHDRAPVSVLVRFDLFRVEVTGLENAHPMIGRQS
ncbi:MAG: hypothetical protein NXH85_03725 [Pseudomonadaceae bacterium]|nr:hypothetical protein [Pseudomonadaceae bacterium]